MMMSPLNMHHIAGMGDALSTFYEARACSRNPAATTRIQPLTFRPPRIANAICAECLSILYEHGPAAKADCAAGLVTDALEHVIEANTLLSGLGVECGGLSVAHGLHNALTLLPETHSKMHGEKVAFGTLVQLMLEGDKAEAGKVARFNKRVGLPTCLQELGVVLDETKLELLVGCCLSPDSTCWTIGEHLTADLLKDAILAADELGRSI
jgi:glycerol dehydrogenase